VDHLNLAVLAPGRVAAEVDDNHELFNRELRPDARRMTLVRPPFGTPRIFPADEAIRKRVGTVLRTRGVVCMWSRHFDSSDRKDNHPDNSCNFVFSGIKKYLYLLYAGCTLYLSIAV
jgi:peptidoglycan-N-acetylglucosamine deacetylase